MARRRSPRRSRMPQRRASRWTTSQAYGGAARGARDGRCVAAARCAAAPPAGRAVGSRMVAPVARQSRAPAMPGPTPASTPGDGRAENDHPSRLREWGATQPWLNRARSLAPSDPQIVSRGTPSSVQPSATAQSVAAAVEGPTPGRRRDRWPRSTSKRPAVRFWPLGSLQGPSRGSEVSGRLSPRSLRRPGAAPTPRNTQLTSPSPSVTRSNQSIELYAPRLLVDSSTELVSRSAPPRAASVALTRSPSRRPSAEAWPGCFVDTRWRACGRNCGLRGRAPA